MKAKKHIVDMKDKDQIFCLEHPNGSTLGAWVSTQDEIEETTEEFRETKTNGVKIYEKSSETVIIDAGEKNVILYANMKGQRVKIIADNRDGFSLKDKIVEIVDKAGNLLGKGKAEDLIKT